MVRASLYSVFLLSVFSFRLQSTCWAKYFCPLYFSFAFYGYEWYFCSWTMNGMAGVRKWQCFIFFFAVGRRTKNFQCSQSMRKELKPAPPELPSKALSEPLITLLRGGFSGVFWMWQKKSRCKYRVFLTLYFAEWLWYVGSEILRYMFSSFCVVAVK